MENSSPLSCRSNSMKAEHLQRILYWVVVYKSFPTLYIENFLWYYCREEQKLSMKVENSLEICRKSSFRKFQAQVGKTSWDSPIIFWNLPIPKDPFHFESARRHFFHEFPRIFEWNLWKFDDENCKNSFITFSCGVSNFGYRNLLLFLRLYFCLSILTTVYWWFGNYTIWN